MRVALAAAALGCSTRAASVGMTGGDETDGGGLFCFVCNDATDDAPLAVQVKARIDLTCSSADGCHGSGAGGLDLAPGFELPPLIDVPSVERPDLSRVRPGDPDRSYVYLKVQCDGGIDGGCMPLFSLPNPALAKLMFDWIEAGAPFQ